MELPFVAIIFIVSLLFLRRLLPLPTTWAAGAALLLTLIGYPTIASLVQVSIVSFVTTQVCLPLLYPLLMLFAASAGFLVGRRLASPHHQPVDPF